MDDEFLDIVDDNDNVIGKDLRSNIYIGNHPQKNIRFSNVFIFNSKGYILIAKRSKNRKIFPGCYDYPVSGHVDSGESYYGAAIRETEEELGLKNQKLIQIGKLTPKDGIAGFANIYKFIFDGEIKNYDKEGIEYLRWFELKDILEISKQKPKEFKHSVPIALRIFFDKR